MKTENFDTTMLDQDAERFPWSETTLPSPDPELVIPALEGEALDTERAWLTAFIASRTETHSGLEHAVMPALYRPTGFDLRSPALATVLHRSPTAIKETYRPGLLASPMWTASGRYGTAVTIDPAHWVAFQEWKTRVRVSLPGYGEVPHLVDGPRLLPRSAALDAPQNRENATGDQLAVYDALGRVEGAQRAGMRSALDAVIFNASLPSWSESAHHYLAMIGLGYHVETGTALVDIRTALEELKIGRDTLFEYNYRLKKQGYWAIETSPGPWEQGVVFAHLTPLGLVRAERMLRSVTTRHLPVED